jgi:hypothetical protein
MTETKQCQNCRNSFVIDAEDFNFYEKIQVPPPTLCPECRYQRRLTHRNERTFFKRKCSATGEDIIAIYPPNASFPVYEQKYWESGNWDAFQYGRDFDFSRPFFEQFKELQQLVPRVNLRNFESVNSEYTNQCERNKNCYLLVASSHNENVMYSNWAQYSKDMLDVIYVLEGQLCYETIAAAKPYRLFWCKDIENSFDCWFSFDLKGCNNCFLCFNLRNKSYYWENKPLSKQEWLDRFSAIKTGSYSAVKSLQEQWLEVLARRALHKFADHNKTVNITGDALFECKNVHKSFNMTRAEDCKYCQDGLEMKDCWDSTEVAFKFERCYELHGSANVSRSTCCNICWESHDLYYCDLCSYSSNLFGCISLKHKKYCILNKQYSKEEYENLVPRIIDHMNTMPYVDSKGRIYKYGEFFPPELSPFAYNETIAQEYFPLTKEQAIEQGYRWKDPEPRNYQITITPAQLPDHIKDVPDSITEEIIGCSHEEKCNEQCTHAFKIIRDELQFYRKINLPLPRLCPNCRHYQRLKQRNPLKLWHRKCMCAGQKSEMSAEGGSASGGRNEKLGTGYAYENTIAHFHGNESCPNEFETSYAPDRPEIVYCEQCYNAEVV